MIQINLFTSYADRLPFTKLALNELTKIKEKNKDLVSLHIYFNKSSKDIWVKELTQEKYSGFDIVLHLMDKDEYILKIPIAHNTNFPYSCKWDDDVLIGTPTWDYIIDNINILELDPNISVLAPQLTNGIPTVDLFMRDLLIQEEREIANEMFLKDGLKNVLDIWGANYRPVQTFIEQMKEWDADEYWNFVETFNPKATRPNLPDNYKWAKGIHPARFSYEFNMFIANKILQKKDKLFGKNNFYIESKDTAYFCNNIYFTKTNYWKESFEILTDGYDEGQLTIYAKAKGMKPAYIRNSFGIHMAYGCTHKQKEIESYYIKNLCSN
jgi:hypothetical protein